MERDENRMQSEQQDEPKFLVTVTLIVNDIGRLVAFYRDVFGGRVLGGGEPTFLRLGNIWLSINRGGGPPDDKPTVIASPPQQPDILSSFINLRVADMARCYELWRSRGANFVTEPEMPAWGDRCYIPAPPASS